MLEIGVPIEGRHIREVGDRCRSTYKIGLNKSCDL